MLFVSNNENKEKDNHTAELKYRQLLPFSKYIKYFSFLDLWVSFTAKVSLIQVK